jgi:enoyl-CoA hydratase
VTEHSDYEDIRVELRADGVGVVTFNRPEKLNAVTGQTFTDLERALCELGSRADCGAIVIAGSGRAFCAGMDLRAPLDGRAGVPIEAAYAVLRRGTRVIIALREIPQPVIAAVRGHAVGAGFAMAAAADIRICSADAQFSAPFIKIGMTAGDLGLSWLLPRLIGAGAASELFYTSGTIDAATAHRLGLVQRVVDDPLTEAIDLAAAIAMRPSLAVQMSKELLNASIAAGGFREHLEVELRSQVIALLTPDHQEAASRFQPRRKT